MQSSKANQSSRSDNDVVAMRAGTTTDDAEVDIQSIVPFEPYAVIVKSFNELMKDKDECTNLGYILKHPAIVVQKLTKKFNSTDLPPQAKDILKILGQWNKEYVTHTIALWTAHLLRGVHGNYALCLVAAVCRRDREG